MERGPGVDASTGPGPAPCERILAEAACIITAVRRHVTGCRADPHPGDRAVLPVAGRRPASGRAGRSETTLSGSCARDSAMSMRYRAMPAEAVPGPRGADVGGEEGRPRPGRLIPIAPGPVSDARPAGGAPGGRDRHAGPGGRAGDHLDLAGAGGPAPQPGRAGVVAPVTTGGRPSAAARGSCGGVPRDGPAGRGTAGVGRPPPGPSSRTGRGARRGRRCGLPGCRGQAFVDLADELGEQGLAGTLAISFRLETGCAIWTLKRPG